MTKSLLIKITVGIAALAIFGILFVRSLADTRGAAYTIPTQHLKGWTLALEPASSPNEPLLALRPSPELSTGLFKQVFSRAMESLNTPASPMVALMLRSEFDRVAGDRLTQEALLVAAQAAGLPGPGFTPLYMVHRYISEPGRIRQAYFVYFNAPEIHAFRREIGLDADALAPVLFVAAAGADFNSWLPQRVNASEDCLAPIEIAG